MTFDATSTAADVIAGIDLTGQTVVLTGASAGLGVETARTLADAGARVIGTVRDRAKGEAALAGVDGVELVELDLVRGRVVNPSSRGHLRSGIRWDDPHYREDPASYEKWQAYGQSKTANILFSVGLAARGVASFAVHPGRIPTELSRHLTQEDFADLASRGRAASPIALKTPAQGAATTIYSATSPDLDGRSGLYLEDCHVSTVVASTTEEPEGHRGDALDPEQAERLWAWSEREVGRARSV